MAPGGRRPPGRLGGGHSTGGRFGLVGEGFGDGSQLSVPSVASGQELRRQAEAVLQDGETLSSFVLDVLTRSIV
ncbi:MAG TPA: hypothetical protein VJ376_01510 [Pseudomonadota bacterium]|nr:hypothetical protein [Pseudomonadota bacterium]